MLGLLDYVRYNEEFVPYIEVLFHTFYCNFARAEKHCSLNLGSTVHLFSRCTSASPLPPPLKVIPFSVLDKRLRSSQVAHQAGGYPCFSRMK